LLNGHTVDGRSDATTQAAMNRLYCAG
jgi:hypothetical protein